MMPLIFQSRGRPVLMSRYHKFGWVRCEPQLYSCDGRTIYILNDNKCHMSLGVIVIYGVRFCSSWGVITNMLDGIVCEAPLCKAATVS
jgi:hypothetical protein